MESPFLDINGENILNNDDSQEYIKLRERYKEYIKFKCFNYNDNKFFIKEYFSKDEYYIDGDKIIFSGKT